MLDNPSDNRTREEVNAMFLNVMGFTSFLVWSQIKTPTLGPTKERQLGAGDFPVRYPSGFG